MFLVWFDNQGQLEEVQNILGVMFTNLKHTCGEAKAFEMDHNLAILVTDLIKILKGRSS